MYAFLSMPLSLHIGTHVVESHLVYSRHSPSFLLSSPYPSSNPHSAPAAKGSKSPPRGASPPRPK